MGNIFRWFVTKRHKVLFHGEKHVLTSSRFKTSKESPQEFVDRNGVICGCCGELMFPGEKIWLFVPCNKDKFNKPGVLVVGEGDDRSMVACLSWGCADTAGVMCGELLQDRKVRLFESPMQKAMRTGDVVIVNSVKDYRG